VSESFIWISYVVTYGLIAGYVLTVWNRLRAQRERSTDRRP
jgi:hypothetical protein